MVKPLWTADELAKACKGQIHGDFEVTGHVHIDSRKLEAGDLFIAIEGENRDAHDFLSPTAAGSLVHKDLERPALDWPHVRVDNTFEALWNLAAAARDRSQARRIAITGSVGKTSTKELFAAAFAAVGQTHATEGNFNNHYGLPLTLARMHQETEFAVLEMGMDKAGEISALTKLAKPHIALITKIAAAHLENFDSIEGIAWAKAEIFEGQVTGGFVLLNLNDSFFPMLAEKAHAAGLKVLGYGYGDQEEGMYLYGDPAQLYGSALIETRILKPEGGQKLRASIGGQAFDFELAMSSAHFGASAIAVLLAACVSQDLQGSNLSCLPNSQLKAMTTSMARVTPLPGRGQVTLLNQGMILTDESYNASPIAMTAAFDTLVLQAETLAVREKQQEGKALTRRKVACLGDMLELGPSSKEVHAELGRTLVGKGFEVLYGCGPYMKFCCDAARDKARKIGATLEVMHFDKSDLFAPQIADLFQANDLILVKGSLGSAMGQICLSLKQRAML